MIIKDKKELIMENTKKFNRILLTGAAGGLGSIFRERLKKYTDKLRISDINEITNLKSLDQEQEEIIYCDLAQKEAVYELVKGVDAIIHFGGVSTEHSFEEILGPNICGTYHIYEAARKHRVSRIIFASSNHVVGFHSRNEMLDTNCIRKPDGYYGLSKSYGEDLATFYWHRYGIETLSIRIGSSYPEPKNKRMLSTWLHYDDLEQLIIKGLTLPNLEHTVIFGASNNPKKWWSNKCSSHLNYQPEYSADKYEMKLRASSSFDFDPGALYQGGSFTEAGPFEG